jgi:hypothetical protein
MVQGTATAEATVNRARGWLERFFSRKDPLYDHYAEIGQAKSRPAKAFYLLMHLLPGIVAWAVINVNSIYKAQLRLTGLPGRTLQYAWLIVVACSQLHVDPPCVLDWDGLYGTKPEIRSENK